MTAFVTQPQFSHGDQPTHTNFNKWGTGLTHIYELVPSYAVNSGVLELDTGEQVTINHRQRWLHYKSSGQIIDPAGIEDDVSLPNTSDDWFNVYDLDTVSWLAYGAKYRVQGVDYAMEDDTP